jgi:sulfide:quinone oxidoreductase
LVQELKQGKALFTQPPMPIKCAGAPQKALYLSASEWLSAGRLKDIDVSFYNAGGVLFGVADYVPSLMEYMEKYSVDLQFNNTLFKVDGESKTAWFKTKNDAGEETIVESKFDMLHVCPPQCAPDFIRDSALSDAGGWLDVDPASLQHKQYKNIWGAGDVMNTANAKTMAAARKQAPVVAHNIANALSGSNSKAAYDGYGSCPLTVEKGKIILAEFTYGGKVNPTFPDWVNDGLTATKLAWTLKASVLPAVYWNAMLKGREWFAGPK